MATIISIEKQQLTPTPEDFLEAARYLGYRKVSPPDSQVSALIKNCCEEMLKILTPKACFAAFDLTVANKISFANLQMESESLKINLRNCSQVYLMAATIGPQVDALIRKTQHFDSVKASVFQAVGAMFIEKTVDLVNEQIKNTAQSQGKNCKPRFSPGYGDVSLEIQKDFFRLLPCSKIGLTLMDTLIMAPEKSVTAFIGIY